MNGTSVMTGLAGVNVYYAQKLLDWTVKFTTAINELLEDIAAGRKYMKVYKQMKMYNDPELNPMLKGQTL